MKRFFNIILVSAILVTFSQCGNSKSTITKLQKHTPFKIQKATYQNWVAGVKGGGSGITIIIDLDEIDTIGANDLFVFDSIFFRNQSAKLEIKGNQYQIIGRFKTEINQREDIILHKDAQMEYGNEPPKSEAKPWDELTNEEAIISYTQHGELKYYKLKLTKKESTLYQ